MVGVAIARTLTSLVRAAKGLHRIERSVFPVAAVDTVERAHTLNFFVAMRDPSGIPIVGPP